MPRAFRFVVPLLGVLTLALLNTPGAAAIPTWCKTDPIVDIGGKRAHIYVSSHDAILGSVAGPTKVRIAVPVGVATELIGTDEGFGEGYDVEFVESDQLRQNEGSIPVVVDAFVPSGLDLPVKVEITEGRDLNRGRSVGATNEWVTAKARL